MFLRSLKNDRVRTDGFSVRSRYLYQSEEKEVMERAKKRI